jgi:hypothetical protein
MFDGTGSLFIPLSASHEITHEVSSSHALTASMADRHNPNNPVTGKGYISITHGTTLSGGSAALYLGTTNSGMDIVRLNDSSISLGGVTQQYGWRIFGIKHGLVGNTYTTEIDNLIATGSLKIQGPVSIDGPTRTLYTSASMVYSGSNVTQVTQSYEAGTQQITNILYSGSFADGNPLSIAVTGSDGINKLYTMEYSASLITQITVT